MRKGIHTLRGQLSLPMTEARRTQLFNGSWTKNFKVVDVQIFPASPVNNDTLLVLHFDDNLKNAFDARSNAQFGWAATDALAQDWSYIDPDHVIVQDMFISAFAAAPGLVNYVIKVERITTTMPEAILAEVKSQLQS